MRLPALWPGPGTSGNKRSNASRAHDWTNNRQSRTKVSMSCVAARQIMHVYADCASSLAVLHWVSVVLYFPASRPLPLVGMPPIFLVPATASHSSAPDVSVGIQSAIKVVDHFLVIERGMYVTLMTNTRFHYEFPPQKAPPRLGCGAITNL
jgi:hypothetical protein